MSTAAPRSTADAKALMRSAWHSLTSRPWGIALLGLGWAGIAWLRLSSEARSAVWAEDGRDFLADAVEHGGLLAVFRPYAGYMHLMPRIIAAATVGFPIESWALLLTAFSCLTAGAIAVCVYLLSRSVTSSTTTRLALASVTVLAPILWYEVLGNAANLHTLFLWSAPWLLLARPGSWPRALALGAVAFVAAATEIQIAAFVPLLLWRFGRLSIPLTIGVLAGLSTQAVAFLTSERPGGAQALPLPSSIIDGFFLHASMTSWLGSVRAAAILIMLGGWLIAYLSALPAFGAGWLLWRRRDAPGIRLLVVALAAGAVVIWTAGFTLNPSGLDYGNLGPRELAESAQTLRYGAAPSMFLLSLVVLGLDRLRSSPRTTRSRRVGSLGLIALALVAAINFVGWGASPRSGGPDWSVSLESGRNACALPGTETAQLPIAPSEAPWLTAVPCALLDEEP